MGKTITTRLSNEFIFNLGNIAKIENVDTSTIMRKLLANAMKEWKKNYAVEQYKKGEFSFGQAARFAEVSVWEFPNLLKERKVSINYDKEEFEFDLKTIRWKKK